MLKKNTFFIETILLQILWLVAGLIFSYILINLLDNLVFATIDHNQGLNLAQGVYYEARPYIMLLILPCLIVLGAFAIQYKRFKKYQSYYASGMAYLKGDAPSVETFHESMADDRLTFINLRQKQVDMERDYQIAYREKTDLLTYLAHDIKTPLANMLGYTKLLHEEEDLSPDQRGKFIQVIYDNANYLNKLTEDFFDYLKFSLNDIPLQIVKLDVTVFFFQWAEERELSLKNKTLQVTFSNCQDITLQTDPHLLLRVMDNLINNAQKYALDQSQIHVYVARDEKLLSVQVMNEVDQDLTFDWSKAKSRFYQGDYSRNRLINEGSGLGLTIVDDIVRHLGGHFAIDQNEAKVTASLTFPLP